MTNHFSRRVVDDAIDRAVREMMQRDPSPWMRGRVLAKLRGGSPFARFAALLRPAFLMPLAAAVTLLITVILWPTAPSRSPNALSQSQTAPSPSPTAPSQSPTAPSPSPTAPSPSPTAPSLFGPRGRVAAASIDKVTPAVTVARDESIPPSLPTVLVAPLAPINEIRVAPLRIQPLTISPLSPPR